MGIPSASIFRRSAFGRPVSSTVVLIIPLLVSLAECKVFNVLDFGARPDSSKDNGKAFLSAWKEACAYHKGHESTLLVPKGTYMFKKARLVGPCKPKSIKFQLDGDLKAFSGYYGEDNWLSFQYVDGLVFSGRGKLDGRGETTWHHNDCQKNSKCGPFPANLRFDMVTNAIVKDVTSLNSKNTHINLFGCTNMKLTNIKILAPADSPNTDGIHIGGSRKIRIVDSIIATGDDCISFSPGTHIVGIFRVTCGPGHGISIGSLGRGKEGETVTRVRVKDSTFLNTDNGVRVKTWPNSYQGLVDGLTFENINMKNVSNPIIIDQEYCPASLCNLQNPSRVQVKNVVFKNIYGTSSSKVAVSLKCSQSNPCQNVQLDDINLAYVGKFNSKAVSSCSNVKGYSKGQQNPPACI